MFKANSFSRQMAMTFLHQLNQFAKKTDVN